MEKKFQRWELCGKKLSLWRFLWQLGDFIMKGCEWKENLEQQQKVLKSFSHGNSPLKCWADIKNGNKELDFLIHYPGLVCNTLKQRESDIKYYAQQRRLWWSWSKWEGKKIRLSTMKVGMLILRPIFLIPKENVSKNELDNIYLHFWICLFQMVLQVYLKWLKVHEVIQAQEASLVGKHFALKIWILRDLHK